MKTEIEHIRTHIFKMTQGEFAAIAGRSQPTISRWEKGASPSLEDAKAIRQAARDRNIGLRDKSFFELPVAAA